MLAFATSADYHQPVHLYSLIMIIELWYSSFLISCFHCLEAGIYLIEDPKLDYDATSTYDLTIECKDTYGNTVTGKFWVNVIKNQLPIFSNLASKFWKKNKNDIKLFSESSRFWFSHSKIYMYCRLKMNFFTFVYEIIVWRYLHIVLT